MWFASLSKLPNLVALSVALTGQVCGDARDATKVGQLSDFQPAPSLIALQSPV
jgi:hypothetical protein